MMRLPSDSAWLTYFRMARGGHGVGIWKMHLDLRRVGLSGYLPIIAIGSNNNRLHRLASFEALGTSWETFCLFHCFFVEGACSLARM